MPVIYLEAETRGSFAPRSSRPALSQKKKNRNRKIKGI
jgi:hypothetical protein